MGAAERQVLLQEILGQNAKQPDVTRGTRLHFSTANQQVKTSSAGCLIGTGQAARADCRVCALSQRQLSKKEKETLGDDQLKVIIRRITDIIIIVTFVKLTIIAIFDISQ